ncbi:flap endonuclease 1-like [Yasminevirus sp. GU-2018]|uniref:Flap endonuclease 1-like n=1 Tax=Yasminevirus sp. GU-2018 TaxID=2420051 RepID=A0A5K0U8X9_9VIRU|nr:flap endonuclease 1-like [Yasminevirus sp. GU-2018]
MGVRKLNKFLTNREIIKTYRNIQEFIDNLKSSGDDDLSDRDKSDKSERSEELDNEDLSKSNLPIQLPHTPRKNNAHNGKIVIAIDFWLYAHKFLHSCRSDNILLGFWNQIMKFLSYGVIPLYVMDGSVPIEKIDKIEERNKKRSNYKKKIDEIDEEIDKYININDLVTDNQDIDDNLEVMYEKREKLQKQIKRIKTSELYSIHKLFDVLNIPYIRAEFEADALCAKLYKEKIITCCLSDDMDMLALGCGSTIKFNEGKLIEFNLEQIKESLCLNQEQFVDMCIMFGCDYLQHPLKIECEDVYEMIKKHGSLLGALCSNEHELFNMNNRNVQVIGESYYQVKEIYMNSCDKEYIPAKLRNIKMKKINFDDLTAFLRKLKWFDTSPRNLRSIELDLRGINKMIDDDEL